jgi:hypothetical protein
MTVEVVRARSAGRRRGSPRRQFARDGRLDTRGARVGRQHVGDTGKHRFGHQVGAIGVDDRKQRRRRVVRAQLRNQLERGGAPREADEHGQLALPQLRDRSRRRIGADGFEILRREVALHAIANLRRTVEEHHRVGTPDASLAH